MLDIIKDVLFNMIVIVGLILILTILAYVSGYLIGKVQKSYKIIIQARQIEKNSNYINKDYICIDKNGNTRYSGLTPEKEIEVFNKAIKRSKSIIRLKNQMSGYDDKE